jgi:adenylate kinase
MRLILLGAPGSGKGTQGAVIAEKHGVTTISTGDLFRKNIAEGTELGKAAQGYTSSGTLVPDELVLSMVEDRLGEEDAKNGFILDGFPRTLAQAEGLAKLLSDLDATLDHVVLIDVPDGLIVDRLSSRRTCSKCGAIYNMLAFPPKTEGVCDKCGGELEQREDDVPETILGRLAVFHEMTEPLTDYYGEAGLLRSVDGSKPPEEVSDEVLSVLAG